MIVQKKFLLFLPYLDLKSENINDIYELVV